MRQVLRADSEAACGAEELLPNVRPPGVKSVLSESETRRGAVKGDVRMALEEAPPKRRGKLLAESALENDLEGPEASRTGYFLHPRRASRWSNLPQLQRSGW